MYEDGSGCKVSYFLIIQDKGFSTKNSEDSKGYDCDICFNITDVILFKNLGTRVLTAKWFAMLLSGYSFLPFSATHFEQNMIEQVCSFNTLLATQHPPPPINDHCVRCIKWNTMAKWISNKNQLYIRNSYHIVPLAKLVLHIKSMKQLQNALYHLQLFVVKITAWYVTFLT